MTMQIDIQMGLLYTAYIGKIQSYNDHVNRYIDGIVVYSIYWKD